MYSKNLLITENWAEIKQAENLGIDVPKSNMRKTEILFWKQNVKKAIIDPIENRIILEFDDESTHEFEHDQAIWNELKKYFKANED